MTQSKTPRAEPKPLENPVFLDAVFTSVDTKATPILAELISEWKESVSGLR